MSVTITMNPNQKPFPDLKNMNERESFLRNYEEWPVYCYNEFTEETFYRYKLPDGFTIIVRSYPYHTDWKFKEELTGQVYYLIDPFNAKHFHNCQTTLTALKNHLTKIRKGNK